MANINNKLNIFFILVPIDIVFLSAKSDKDFQFNIYVLLGKHSAKIFCLINTELLNGKYLTFLL